MFRSTAQFEDRLAWLLTHLTVALVAAAFLAIVLQLIVKGSGGLTLDFFLAPPANAGREGGISTIIVSTLMILGICLAVSVPVGVGTAILLSEFTSEHHAFGRGVRLSLDILAGVPSIVFGLFGNAFFSKTLGMGFSILSGGLTLACMVLPILIRTTEEGLRLVPAEYRYSGAALALSRTTILFRFVLPAAVPGLIVGLVLGVGRALAETAALIFTSGYVDRMPESVMDSGRALSIHIFDLSMNISGGDANAYKSAMTLLIIILLVNGLATGVASRWMKKRIEVL